jgi:hypothetical protein
MEFIKKNFALLLAFTLPVVLIIVVALSAYLSSLVIRTNYNFIYTTCGDGANNYPYRCDSYLQKRYSVVDNKLILKPVDMTEDADKDGMPDFNEKYVGRIFLHNTKTNESQEITSEEAQTMKLSSLLTSPDGITVSNHYNRSGGDFPFFFSGGSSSYGYYLTKGNSWSKINLINSSNLYYYGDNFQFMGGSCQAEISKKI